MSINTKFLVRPVFGNGWNLYGMPIDTPVPFTLSVLSTHISKERGTMIIGSPSIVLDDTKSLYLSLWSRANYGDTTAYTVLIHDRPPDMAEILQSNTAPTSIGEGYATIDNDVIAVSIIAP